MLPGLISLSSKGTVGPTTRALQAGGGRPRQGPRGDFRGRAPRGPLQHAKREGRAPERSLSMATTAGAQGYRCPL